MLTYVTRRLLYSIPVLFATSFIIFTFVSYAGDPLGQLKLNPYLSQETLQKKIEEKHLDKPVPVRYLYWVRDATTNKFGDSLVSNQPVWPDLKRVIPHTLQLVLSAELLAILIAVGIGVYSATRQYSVFDYSATTFSFLAFAVPVFWFALMLQIGATTIYTKWHVRVFYTSGLSSVDPGSGPHFVLDRAQHLALPVITIALIEIASYSRFLRASMLEVINSDYTRTARAKGLSERRVTMKHAFRNALIPLVTLVALSFGTVIAGAVVTESIFQLDGMGYYFVQSLQRYDTYAVMAFLMIVAASVIVFNLIADLVYGVLDPRVRLE
jgi:peptide/nickel transport system permease protein